METNEQKLPAETPKKAKSVRVPLEEWVVRMKLAFTNAKLPNVLSKLQTIGYTEQKLDGFLAKVTELEELIKNQKKEYGEQYAETKKAEQKREEINELYTRHLAFCKILFKGDVQANATLGLSAGRKSAYSAWLQQVSNFYAQLLGNDAFKTKVATINILEKDLKTQQTALAELEKIKETQKKETGEAQKATDMRDEAFDKLYPSYTELISYAKILFEGDQTLEQLGIITKKK